MKGRALVLVALLLLLSNAHAQYVLNLQFVPNKHANSAYFQTPESLIFYDFYYDTYNMYTENYVYLVRTSDLNIVSSIMYIDGYPAAFGPSATQLDPFSTTIHIGGASVDKYGGVYITHFDVNSSAIIRKPDILQNIGGGEFYTWAIAQYDPQVLSPAYTEPVLLFTVIDVSTYPASVKVYYYDYNSTPTLVTSIPVYQIRPYFNADDYNALYYLLATQPFALYSDSNGGVLAMYLDGNIYFIHFSPLGRYVERAPVSGALSYPPIAMYRYYDPAEGTVFFLFYMIPTNPPYGHTWKYAVQTCTQLGLSISCLPPQYTEEFTLPAAPSFYPKVVVKNGTEPALGVFVLHPEGYGPAVLYDPSGGIIFADVNVTGFSTRYTTTLLQFDVPEGNYFPNISPVALSITSGTQTYNFGFAAISSSGRVLNLIPYRVLYEDQGLAFADATLVYVAPPAQPNLTITDVNYNTLYKEGTGTITVTVSNNGDANTDNVLVRLQLENATTGTFTFDQNIATLPAGSSAQVTFDISTLPTSPTPYTIYVIVDPDNTIAESNEADNEYNVVGAFSVTPHGCYPVDSPTIITSSGCFDILGDTSVDINAQTTSNVTIYLNNHLLEVTGTDNGNSLELNVYGPGTVNKIKLNTSNAGSTVYFYDMNIYFGTTSDPGYLVITHAHFINTNIKLIQYFQAYDVYLDNTIVDLRNTVNWIYSSPTPVTPYYRVVATYVYPTNSYILAPDGVQYPISGTPQSGYALLTTDIGGATITSVTIPIIAFASRITLTDANVGFMIVNLDPIVTLNNSEVNKILAIDSTRFYSSGSTATLDILDTAWGVYAPSPIVNSNITAYRGKLSLNAGCTDSNIHSDVDMAVSGTVTNCNLSGYHILTANMTGTGTIRDWSTLNIQKIEGNNLITIYYTDPYTEMYLNGINGILRNVKLVGRFVCGGTFQEISNVDVSEAELSQSCYDLGFPSPPNIKVIDVQAQPPAIDYDQNTELNIVLQNTGGQDITDWFIVHVKVVQQSTGFTADIDYNVTDGIPGGALKYITIPFRYLDYFAPSTDPNDWNFTIEVYADYNNHIAETNEADNYLSKPNALYVVTPNLRVELTSTNAHATEFPDYTYYSGETFEGNFTIYNDGYADRNVLVHILVNGGLHDARWIYIPAHSSNVVRVTYPNLSAGHYTISVVVDPDDAVEETSETDNRADADFNVVNYIETCTGTVDINEPTVVSLTSDANTCYLQVYAPTYVHTNGYELGGVFNHSNVFIDGSGKTTLVNYSYAEVNGLSSLDFNATYSATATRIFNTKEVRFDYSTAPDFTLFISRVHLEDSNIAYMPLAAFYDSNFINVYAIPPLTDVPARVHTTPATSGFIIIPRTTVPIPISDANLAGASIYIDLNDIDLFNTQLWNYAVLITTGNITLKNTAVMVREANITGRTLTVIDSNVTGESVRVAGHDEVNISNSTVGANDLTILTSGSAAYISNTTIRAIDSLRIYNNYVNGKIYVDLTKGHVFIITEDTTSTTIQPLSCISGPYYLVMTPNAKINTVFDGTCNPIDYYGDLRPTEITVTSPHVYQGENFDVQFTIESTYTFGEINVPYEILVDGVQATTKQYITVGPSSTVTVTVTVPAPMDLGTHTVTVVIDPSNEVPEIEDYNNMLSTTFMVEQKVETGGGGLPTFTHAGGTSFVAAPGVVEVSGRGGETKEITIPIRWIMPYPARAYIEYEGAVSGPDTILLRPGENELKVTVKIIGPEIGKIKIRAAGHESVIYLRASVLAQQESPIGIHQMPAILIIALVVIAALFFARGAIV